MPPKTYPLFYALVPFVYARLPLGSRQPWLKRAIKVSFMNILDIVRTVPDYPYKGINFYDVNSIFAAPQWPLCIDAMVKKIKTLPEKPTHIIGVESRGFVIAGALSHALGIPCVMVRKEGAKYPGELYRAGYALEYGEAVLTLQSTVLKTGDRVILADDLIATGGSLQATQKLVGRCGAEVLAWITLINLVYINKGKLGNQTLALADIEA